MRIARVADAWGPMLNFEIPRIVARPHPRILSGEAHEDREQISETTVYNYPVSCLSFFESLGGFTDAGQSGAACYVASTARCARGYGRGLWNDKGYTRWPVECGSNQTTPQDLPRARRKEAREYGRAPGVIEVLTTHHPASGVFLPMLGAPIQSMLLQPSCQVWRCDLDRTRARAASREGYAELRREPVHPASGNLSPMDDAETTVACRRDLERQRAGDASPRRSRSAGLNGEGKATGDALERCAPVCARRVAMLRAKGNATIAKVRLVVTRCTTNGPRPIRRDLVKINAKNKLNSAWKQLVLVVDHAGFANPN